MWDMRVVKLPTELNFDENQSYIIEQLNEYISTKFGDTQCEDCGEITVEKVVGYNCITNGREHSILNLSNSEGRYRVINLVLTTTFAPRGETTDILKAKLAKIDGTGMFYPLEYEMFVIQRDQPLCEAMIARPERPITLDLKDFLLKDTDASFSDKLQAYCHTDYVDWLVETS